MQLVPHHFGKDCTPRALEILYLLLHTFLPWFTPPKPPPLLNSKAFVDRPQPWDEIPYGNISKRGSLAESVTSALKWEKKHGLALPPILSLYSWGPIVCEGGL